MKKVMTCLLLLCLLLYMGSAQAAVLRRGSNGAEVKKVQQKLKELGYYNAAVDGIFGPQTEAAVRSFQKAKGLTVDGIVGPQTMKALGLQSSGSSNTSNEVYLLARAVYGESRGEPYTGMVAVAAVILNRVDDANFPNTISGVIYQPGAFDVVSDGQINLSPDETAVRAARDAMAGWDPTNGCLYYYNPKTATNKWIRSKPVVVTIGSHVFCL